MLSLQIRRHAAKAQFMKRELSLIPCLVQSAHAKVVFNCDYVHRTRKCMQSMFTCMSAPVDVFLPGLMPAELPGNTNAPIHVLLWNGNTCRNGMFGRRNSPSSVVSVRYSEWLSSCLRNPRPCEWVNKQLYQEFVNLLGGAMQPGQMPFRQDWISHTQTNTDPCKITTLCSGVSVHQFGLPMLKTILEYPTKSDHYEAVSLYAIRNLIALVILLQVELMLQEPDFVASINCSWPDRVKQIETQLLVLVQEMRNHQVHIRLLRCWSSENHSFEFCLSMSNKYTFFSLNDTSICFNFHQPSMAQWRSIAK